MKKVLCIFVLGLTIMGCTENERARKFGGTSHYTLEPGQRLVTVTWKETDLWILTKEDSSTPPGKYTFEEKSSFGIIEGKVVITEQ